MSQASLFSDQERIGDALKAASRPLADRMRPTSLDSFFGQRHLLDPGKPLRHALASGELHSMILWGPPGTGKTTLGRLIAAQANAQFLAISAVLAGVKDIRKAVESAQFHRREHGASTVLFVDEVHRFNKAQQDGFLPYVEDGTLTFVGATTENPAFELNNALLSRARVYVLKRLGEEDLRQVIEQAIEDTDNGLGALGITLGGEGANLIVHAAEGDARRALNILDLVCELARQEDASSEIPESAVTAVLESDRLRRFDKGGDRFYDQISALHKSIRGSSPDAALYWLARMLDGGCDPRYIARRLTRVASEDIGNADPRALHICLDAWEVQERLGSPEGELALAQATSYLACAAKSNAVYKAYQAACEDVRQLGDYEVPIHLRNAPTRLAREMGHGKTYRYPFDEAEAYAAGESYFPEEMAGRRYYFPADRGLEERIREKLARLEALDRAGQAPNKDN